MTLVDSECQEPLHLSVSLRFDFPEKWLRGKEPRCLHAYFRPVNVNSFYMMRGGNSYCGEDRVTEKCHCNDGRKPQLGCLVVRRLHFVQITPPVVLF